MKTKWRCWTWSFLPCGQSADKKYWYQNGIILGNCVIDQVELFSKSPQDCIGCHSFSPLKKTKGKLLTRFGFVRRWAGWEGFCTQSQPLLSPARRRGFWKANRLFWFGWNFWKRTITMKMTKTLSTIDHLCSEESPSKRLASIQVVSSGYSTNLRTFCTDIRLNIQVVSSGYSTNLPNHPL